MSCLLFLLDVPPPASHPVGVVPWGALVLLLVVVLILAVAFAAGLVFLVIVSR